MIEFLVSWCSKVRECLPSCIPYTFYGSTHISFSLLQCNVIQLAEIYISKVIRTWCYTNIRVSLISIYSNCCISGSGGHLYSFIYIFFDCCCYFYYYYYYCFYCDTIHILCGLAVSHYFVCFLFVIRFSFEFLIFLYTTIRITHSMGLKKILHLFPYIQFFSPLLLVTTIALTEDDGIHSGLQQQTWRGDGSFEWCRLMLCGIPTLRKLFILHKTDACVWRVCVCARNDYCLMSCRQNIMTVASIERKVS